MIGFPKKLTFLFPVLVRPLGLSVALRTDDRFFFFCLSRPMIVVLLVTESAYDDETDPFPSPALERSQAFRVPQTGRVLNGQYLAPVKVVENGEFFWRGASLALPEPSLWAWSL
jgi:hypothetical protein